MTWTRRRWTLSLAAAAVGCGADSGEAPADPDPNLPGPELPRHVIDLHCDTPMLLDGGYDLGAWNESGQVDIPRMRRGGVTAVFFSVYTSAHRNTELESVQKALEIIDLVRREVARFPDDLTLAASSRDLETARSANRIAIFLGIEGGHMINSSLGVLRSLYSLGGRYLTLTHTKDTPWAGTSADPKNTGLSEFGREVVTEMNRLGMLVDVSHVSDQTFADVLETSSAPIIASHSSARALAAHSRNMTDSMIRATAERGGVVHVNYYNTFLDDDYRERSRRWEDEHPRTDGPEGAEARTAAKLAAIGRTSFDTALDHFAHIAQVGGIEAVGMGSDFDGVEGELPEGLEDISKIPNLAEGLRGRGFSAGDIEKILGGNSLRVLRDVEAASEAGAA